MGKIFREGGERFFSLEYIPEKTPYREHHINELYSYLDNEIKSGSFRPPILLGPSGTGKTTVVNKTLKLIGMKWDKIITRNFNMMLVNSTYSAIRMICSFTTPIPDRGLSLNEIIERLYGTLEMDDSIYIVGLDDVDELLRRERGRILEILTRVNEDYGVYRVFPIVVVRNIKPLYVLPDHIKSKIGGITINFNPYSSKELIEIVNERIEKGLNEDSITQNAINVSAIISEKIYGGNAREMINLIYKSSLYCEKKNIRRVTVETIRKVFFHEYYKHVKQDIRDTVKTNILSTIILSLDEDSYIIEDDRLDDIITEIHERYGYKKEEIIKNIRELIGRGYLAEKEGRILQIYLPKDIFLSYP
ncbi:TPA: hypothetical protein EYP83_00240 [Candidatus Geothermarchaeota archaeon]|nr:hypothetical protein [Candidatus Geothermarchaeota archaeon]HIQ13646.1 hypothetical protein [Thermoprotei archaeon]